MASLCPSIGLGLAVILLMSTDAAAADKKCYCRTATGEHVEVGKVACLRTNNGPRVARCEMVLNNTAWIFTDNPCPVASRGGKQDKTAALAINLAR